jgi:gliding motility-associated-like protein
MGPNGCISKQKVVFTKDTYTPNYVPVSTPSTGITCANPCVAMSPFSTTTTPISFTFTSPAPTQTATTSGALMCVPGPYTMNYINSLNGCPGTSTVFVASNVVSPAIVTPPTYYLPCGQTTTIISANTLTTSPNYSYTWEPATTTTGTVTTVAGMSCLGGTACSTPSVNMAGVYTVLILDTKNGCTVTNTITVASQGLTAGFIADPSSGFSPLTVNFSNTSQVASTIAGTVTTNWNFGNGTTYTTSGSTSSLSIVLTSPSSVYQSAGTYTVSMVLTQFAGTVTCRDSATAVIHVELPSQLEIPNVFTPNGDGVNDIFMLRTTNVTEITCQIFDRWGVKMFDVTSDTGNIEWDGKNLSKKEVPAGTYFYILKAKGKDGKETWTDSKGNEVKQKGTISLYR